MISQFLILIYNLYQNKTDNLTRDFDFIIEVLFQIINHMFVFKLEKDFIKKVGEEFGNKVRVIFGGNVDENNCNELIILKN